MFHSKALRFLLIGAFTLFLIALCLELLNGIFLNTPCNLVEKLVSLYLLNSVVHSDRVSIGPSGFPDCSRLDLPQVFTLGPFSRILFTVLS